MQDAEELNVRKAWKILRQYPRLGSCGRLKSTQHLVSSALNTQTSCKPCLGGFGNTLGFIFLLNEQASFFSSNFCHYSYKGKVCSAVCISELLSPVPCLRMFFVPNLLQENRENLPDLLQLYPGAREPNTLGPGINPAMPMGTWHPSLRQPAGATQVMANLQAGC